MKTLHRKDITSFSLYDRDNGSFGQIEGSDVVGLFAGGVVGALAGVAAAYLAEEFANKRATDYAKAQRAAQEKLQDMSDRERHKRRKTAKQYHDEGKITQVEYETICDRI